MDSIDRTKDFDDIMRTYDSLKTDRERTMAESKLWGMALGSERKALGARLGKKVDRGEWLTEILGDQGTGPRTHNLYDLRARLSQAPSEMWDYIEESECTLHTAVSVYKACLNILSKDNSLSFAAALKTAITEPSTRVRVRNRKRKIARESSRLDWPLLQSIIRKVVKPRLADLPDSLKNRLEDELYEQIHLCFDSFFNKVKRHVEEESGVSLLIRSDRMRNACALLQVDVPPSGELVDLKEAKKKKIAIIQHLHPDHKKRNPEQPGTEQEDNGPYQSIIEAYDAIEAYNDSVEKGT